MTRACPARWRPMARFGPRRLVHGLLTLLVVMIEMTFADPALASYQQATGISQNSVPVTLSNIICTADYTIIADGSTVATPGFCPLSGQTNYAITLTFAVPQTEYASRLVIWSNAGNYFDDSELRIFDLTVTYVDPVTLAPQTYSRYDVQIADTLSATQPVFHDFTDAVGNPIQLYGVKSVRLSNLRNIPISGMTDEAAFREVQLDVHTQPAGPVISVQKTSQVFAETATLPHRIPGNDVFYQIQVANTGAFAVDANSLFIVDHLPDHLEFYNGDADGSGPGTASVVFAGNGGGLSFPAGTVRYATIAPNRIADCNYTPLAGYDPAVRYICIDPAGVLYGNSGFSPPGFTAQFRARIQ